MNRIKLTDTWKENGIKEIYKSWSRVKVGYNMNDTEFVLTNRSGGFLKKMDSNVVSKDNNKLIKNKNSTESSCHLIYNFDNLLA